MSSRPPDFYPALRALCDKYDIPLVVDEVQAGMGRTGKMFAIEHWGVVPDVITIAKGIAGGLPLGAIVAPKRMMTWPSGAHANTFGGNPVACAAAIATIRLLENELMANATEVGAHMLARMQSLARPLPLHRRRARQGPDDRHRPGGGPRHPRPRPRPARPMVDEAFQQGLLLLGAGAGAIRFCPPLVLTKELADEGLDIMERLFAAEA